jgi:hypothetical protein
MSGAPCFKAAPVKRNSGRARPDEPLRLRCEVCDEHPATERHHKLRRSQGGSDEEANTLDVCLVCHLRIHANPAWSYEHGFLIRSGGI